MSVARKAGHVAPFSTHFTEAEFTERDVLETKCGLHEAVSADNPLDVAHRRIAELLDVRARLEAALSRIAITGYATADELRRYASEALGK